jgi:hypothetical protein
MNKSSYKWFFVSIHYIAGVIGAIITWFFLYFLSVFSQFMLFMSLTNYVAIIILPIGFLAGLFNHILNKIFKIQLRLGIGWGYFFLNIIISIIFSMAGLFFLLAFLFDSF